MRKTAKHILQGICYAAIAILLLFAGYSCKKDKETYTITGRLLLKCGDTATVKNLKVMLRARRNISLFGSNRDGFEIDTRTGNDGRFTLNYMKNGEKELTLFSDGGMYISTIVASMYPNKNISLGDIYLRENTPAAFVIETDTPYSSHIRLTYDYPIYNPNNIYDYTYKSIYGPFTNNQYIDTGVTSRNALLKEAPYLIGSPWNYRDGGVWRLYDTLKKREIAWGVMYYDSIIQCKEYNRLIINLKWR